MTFLFFLKWNIFYNPSNTFAKFDFRRFTKSSMSISKIYLHTKAYIYHNYYKYLEARKWLQYQTNVRSGIFRTHFISRAEDLSYRSHDIISCTHNILFISCAQHNILGIRHIITFTIT